nr:MAG TPA_asm: hypothetical protein [Caudoviricetes sp.]
MLFKKSFDIVCAQQYRQAVVVLIDKGAQCRRGGECAFWDNRWERKGVAVLQVGGGRALYNFHQR